MKISIIIPIYNSEKYLDACISSVLEQSYSNFEIILVDDGSTDNSLSICKYYASNDCRIKVISRKNGGVSSARNLGIREAEGEWVCFIDSDDTIDVDFLSSFNLAKSNYSLYIQGYKRVDSKNNILAKHQLSKQCRLDRRSIYIESELQYIINSPCCKLFKVDILRKKKLLFDESISLSEDLIFSLQYMLHVNSVYASRETGYNYYIRNIKSLSQKHVDHDKIYYAAEKIAILRSKICDLYEITDQVFLNFCYRDYVHRIIYSLLNLYQSQRVSNKDRNKILKDYSKILKKNQAFQDLDLQSRLCTIIRYILLNIKYKQILLYSILIIRKYYLKIKK